MLSRIRKHISRKGRPKKGDNTASEYAWRGLTMHRSPFSLVPVRVCVCARMGVHVRVCLVLEPSLRLGQPPQGKGRLLENQWRER